ncbi:MAG TPA: hypothetical protein VGM40_02065 [Mycobacterium sp.]|jgi:hypothetical protein
MATPQQSDNPAAGRHRGTDTTSALAEYDEEAPRVLRVRLAPWDVLCTVVMYVLLVFVATSTSWPTRLFGFLANVCEGDECGLVPVGADMYIYPVVWGGVGAAITAAVVGPVVSILKGWYMSFWPVLALALIVGSAVVGSALTVFSQPYWG